MNHKHQRVRLRFGLHGRAAWREESTAHRTVSIGKITTTTLHPELVAEIVAAGQPIRLYVKAEQFYDHPDPEAIYVARQALIALAPAELRPFVEEVHSIRDWEAWQAFEDRLVAFTLSRAEVVDTRWNGERAPCPLCRAVPSEPGDPRGFAYPEGLTWHLVGRAPARRCVVTRALYDWYRDPEG